MALIRTSNVQINKSRTSAVSDHRILRNGKIIFTQRNIVMKKKSKSGNTRSSTRITTCDKKRKQFNTVYNNLNSDVNTIVQKVPFTILNQFSDCSLNNKNNSTRLENNTRFNQTQTPCNVAVPEINIITKKKTKPFNSSLLMLNKSLVSTLSKSLKKKNTLKTEILHKTVNNKTDLCVRRAKKAKLEVEQQRQLDQILFNKYNCNFLKMLTVRIDDISKKAKFLSLLGLTCSFKCALSINIKNNCN